MMKKKMVLASVLVFLIVVAAAAFTYRNFRASLSGDNEVPVVSTEASGRFSARLSNNGDSFTYRLTYDDLEGEVTQAHIHVGQKDVNGGISVWLCANPALLPPTTVIPPGTQPCPAPPAEIEGEITETQVVGPVGQGVDAGEFDELLRAIRAGNTYANVHSTRFPGGEVRSQIGPGSSRHDH